MMAEGPNRFWWLAIGLLVAVVVAGVVVAWSRYSPNQPIEVYLPPEPEPSGSIYIGGAVANPGLYPLRAGDTIEELIRAAGGTTTDAGPSRLELRILVGGEEGPQRVNINRAEAWLLQALPGIGEITAQAIVEYRQQNGPFHNTREITKVTGIGPVTYERIKHLITVDD